MAQDCIDFVAEKGLVQDTKLLNSLAEIDAAEIDLEKGNPGGSRYVLNMAKVLGNWNNI